MSRKHHAEGRGELLGNVVFLPLSSDSTEGSVGSNLAPVWRMQTEFW